MTERTRAPLRSPTVEGWMSLSHQKRLTPRIGKPVPPFGPWNERMNIANIGP